MSDSASASETRVTPAAPLGFGQALARRIPVDAQGQFPANGALGVALAVSFLWLNQGLLWGASAALADNPEGWGPRLAGFSVLGGAVVWLALFAGQWWAGARRPRDLAIAALTLAGPVASVWFFPSPACGFAGTTGLLLWAARGTRPVRAGT